MKKLILIFSLAMLFFPNQYSMVFGQNNANYRNDYIAGCLPGGTAMTEPDKSDLTVINSNDPPPADATWQASDDRNSTLYHIVAAGETLYSISKRYHTTVDNLKALNNIEDNKIIVGQKLLLDGNSEGSEPPRTSSSQPDFHTVISGETLYCIAKRYNMTVERLRALNNIPDNKIIVGQKLLLDEKATKSEQDVDTTSPIEYHIVVEGETLESIAIKYNLPVNTLRILNQIQSNEIIVGQKLILE